MRKVYHLVCSQIYKRAPQKLIFVCIKKGPFPNTITYTCINNDNDDNNKNNNNRLY